jgi:hypothetical protein
MAPARATRAARAAPLVAALLLASACSASAAFTCTQTDTTCTALGDFYTSLGGPNWTNLTSGATSTDNWHKAAAGTPGISYCSFLGVTCNLGSVSKLCVSMRRKHGALVCPRFHHRGCVAVGGLHHRWHAHTGR